jgi:hypothetical protein
VWFVELRIFFYFCRNWISKFSGMTKFVALIGTVGLLWYLWKTKMLHVFKEFSLRIPLMLFCLCLGC